MLKLYHRRLRRAVVCTCAVFFLVIGLLGCATDQTYTVQPGDSLSDIALAHDVTLTELIKANQDRYPSLAVNPDTPAPGIELVIPARGGIGIEDWFARISRAASPPITPEPNVPAAPNDKINAIVQLIAQQINREREAHNLNDLRVEPRLVDIAQARSNDMIRRQYFAHEDPQTGDVAFQDLIRDKQYKFVFAGENIAEIKNQGSLVPSGLTVYARYGASEIADQFVTGWLGSAEHLQNILNSHFARTGIALGVAVDGTRIVATQIFSD